MNELRQIVARLELARRNGEEAVLATVVKVEGSAYRRPGARMLVAEGGERFGGVSGGCLEDDVVKKAWWLTEVGRAALRRYDATAGDEAQWAFGLGCNGIVYVLFERIAAGDEPLLLQLLRAVRQGRAGAATAAVISAEQIAVGTRLARFPDGCERGTSGDDTLDTRLFADLAAAQQQRRSQLRSYTTPHGPVEAFLEYLAPPQRLVVFGAGYDAQPLVRLAAELGWHVTVADERPHYARPERFPQAAAVLAVDAEQAPAAAAADADSAVVVMTHSYDQDRRLLAQLLRRPPRYLGQLGPRGRTERMLAELGVPESTPPQALHYPAGLDIGGNEPAQVALSVLAEIQAVFAGRNGAMLRERHAPIHGTTPDDALELTAPRAMRR